MKTVRLLSALALLMFGISGNTLAGTGNNLITCTPSTTNNYVACDAGYTGQKYTVTTKTCPEGWPNGIIKTTTTYDTSHCLKSAPPSNGDRTCELTPAACSTMPTSPGCPAGQHWVLTGSTVAHCVNNDPVCGWGTSLVHDGMGNPGCITNTCPSNQVLQGDGISCACPGGTAWNGSSCIALPPPCTPSAVNGGNVACDAGFTGSKHGVTTTSCPGSVVTFAWDISGCIPIAVPPPCTPSSVNGGNVACGAGFTGFKHSVTTTSCPGSVVTLSWDTSACVPIPLPPPVCANGASNYPTCTPPKFMLLCGDNYYNQALVNYGAQGYIVAPMPTDIQYEDRGQYSIPYDSKITYITYGSGNRHWFDFGDGRMWCVMEGH
jgi:hypothetical protein